MTDAGRENAGTNALVCLTWNLGRRRHAGHVDVVRSTRADIVALQEVAAQHQPTLARGLAADGLLHVHGDPNAGRSYPFISMIASRWPLRAADTDGLDVPFPERVQAVIVSTPFGDLEVLNVHVPAATSSGVATKVATFEGLARYLSQPAPVPRIVCGDFNTPKSEAGGRVEYWGNAHQRGAERAFIEGEATTRLRDAFRSVHGPDATASSWRASNGVARRYDHVFVSPELVPIEAAYGDLEQITVAKMSDHAPLRVVFRAMGAANVSTALLQENAPAHPERDTRLTPAPVATSTTVREETAVPTTHDTDPKAFLKGLTYRTDVRKDPDNRRRGQFRAGWTKATDGGAISEEKLRAELSWHNLGFRAGQAFGQATPTTIDDVFERFAAIYVQERS